MSFEDDRERFEIRSGLGYPCEAQRRWWRQRSCAVMAGACLRAGDRAGYEAWMAKANTALEEPAGVPRPPLAFADRRRTPPESPE
jgi:hypothetical protein